jgi:hypothetical protein
VDVCLVNIGAKGRRDRMRFGILMAVVTVAAAIAMLVGGVARPWRLAIAVPALLAGIGVFQARAGT